MAPTINTGVILGERETDFGFAGADSPIPYKVVLPDGDWRPFKPAGEKQYANADSMGCVSFSALNGIETQQKQQTGSAPDYSDRFTAKDSGTTPQGNYVYKVADSIRLKGVVLAEVWPDPVNYTWDTFYSPMPQSVYDQGLAWLKDWRVNPQVIALNKDAFLKALKQAPVQVVFPNHAVLAVYCQQDVVDYFDTYKPWDKTKAFGDLTYAYQYVLSRNNPSPTPMPSKEFCKWLVRCFQAVEGYKDPAGVSYWGDRINKEGWTALKEYFVTRLAAKKTEIDSTGIPPAL